MTEYGDGVCYRVYDAYSVIQANNGDASGNDECVLMPQWQSAI